ncbi:MAG: tetratricopeptide repeat protein [Hyphomicrobium sp.]
MRLSSIIHTVGVVLAMTGLAWVVPKVAVAETGADRPALRQPDGFLEMHDRAVADYLKGELDRALAGFNAAIVLNPHAALAYYNRGNVQYARGDYTAAVTDFTQALGLNPKQPYAHMNRGNALSNLGKLDEALADLDEAVRLQPEISDTWFNRAIVHARRRDLKAALADYEAAIARDADDAEAAAARQRFQAFLGSDGNTAAADTTKILSEIAHARHVEHVLRLVAESCIAHGDNLEGLKTLAIVGGWKPATDADLMRSRSAQSRMDGGWTFSDRFGTYALIRSVTAARPPVYVCSLTTQPVDRHLFEDISAGFKGRFAVQLRDDDRRAEQDARRYQMITPKGTMFATLVFAKDRNALTIRSLHGR